MPARNNHALLIAYDGRPFLGYQPQGPALATVGGVLLSALRRLGIQATPFGASRTDARVQAFGQVASFQTRLDLDPTSLLTRLNDTLPSSVRVLAAARAHPSFHAHWSATGKVYRYRLAPEPTSPSDSDGLDFARLNFALRLLASRDDLAAFSASRERDKHKVRTLDSARLLEASPATGALLEFSGAGFGRYQIRHLVAAALAMARRQITPDELCAMSRGEQRHPPKAPAEGLCLWQVRYPLERDPFARFVPHWHLAPDCLDSFKTRDESARG